MAFYSQTEKYKEEPSNEENFDAVEEAEEAREFETDTTEPITAKKQIKLPKPPMKVAIAIVALIAILLLAWLLLSWGSKKQTIKEEKAQASAVKEEEQFWLDYYKEHPDMQPSETVQSNDSTVVTTEVPVTASLIFSDKQIATLRKWGYTASEIEHASASNLDYDKLISSAKEQQLEMQKEIMKPLNDTMSPEYQNLLNKTWLSGDIIDLEGLSTDTVVNQESAVQNVDYEKCGAQGTQLFLKLHLDDGTSAFVFITPQRYIELQDSGNIVVKVTWTELNSLKIITKIEEVTVG